MAAGISTDRQRECVDDLDRVGRLATDHCQAPLNGCFDRPELGRLANEQGTVRQAWEKLPIVGAKVPIEVLVGMALKILTTNFHADDLFVSQRGGKTTVANHVGSSDDGVVLTH